MKKVLVADITTTDKKGLVEVKLLSYKNGRMTLNCQWMQIEESTTFITSSLFTEEEILNECDIIEIAEMRLSNKKFVDAVRETELYELRSTELLKAV